MKNKVIIGMLKNDANKLPLKYNLQHFASNDSNEDDSDEDDDNDSDSNDDVDDSDDGDDQSKSGDEKKFTQAEMSKTAAREKKQGRRSAFKEMGFKSEKEAKAAMQEFKKWKESQMTPDEKHQQELNNVNTEKSEAEERAQAAEEKLAVVMAGVRKDSIDDVLAIARAKVTEDKSLDDVLEEMKKQDRYKSFFEGEEDSSGSKSTGGSLNHNKGKNKNENIGERLAKQNAKNSSKKSNYF